MNTTLQPIARLAASFLDRWQAARVRRFEHRREELFWPEPIGPDRIIQTRTTTPCCECGSTRGVPWSEDTEQPECVSCWHVCAHVDGFGRAPFRWADR